MNNSHSSWRSPTTLICEQWNTPASLLSQQANHILDESSFVQTQNSENIPATVANSKNDGFPPARPRSGISGQFCTAGRGDCEACVGDPKMRRNT